MQSSDSFATSPEISVIVPVYNAEATLPELTRRLTTVLQKLGLEYEILFVNDGSTDRSWGIIENLARAKSGVRGIDLARNFGQHNALLCGIRQARGRLLVTLDDDLQNPPEEIPKLLAGLTPDLDVVYGSPQAERHGLLRDLASQITKLALQEALGATTARRVSAFRLIRNTLRAGFADYKGTFVSIDVLLTWGTNRFASVQVRHDPRFAGTSNYTMRKLLVHALNMMTGFSTVPLQVASLLGFVATLFGVLVLAFVLGRYILQGVTVPGFTFLASIITLFAGTQLFAIGVIGEYLARMHFRMLERPAYLVRGETQQEVAA